MHGSIPTSPDQDRKAPLIIRRIQPEDAESCGRIAFEAHHVVATAHNFPPEHPSVEFSIGLMKAKITDQNAFGAVVERDGRIVGSIFLNTFPPAPVVAIGPLTVDPKAGGGVGKLLMETALEESRRRGYECVRLVQSPNHFRSLALYTKLGFAVREPLVLIQGAPSKAPQTVGLAVRLVMDEDLPSCNKLCFEKHGFSREFELRSAIEQRAAILVERAGKIVGYAAGIGFRGHAVAETFEYLKAAICAAPKLPGPGVFVPTRQTELLHWLLESGGKALWPATLMTLGPYQDPSGAFLPSIAY